MTHDRKYVASGVALVKGRLRSRNKMDQDGIETLILKQNGFLENAPFKWVGVLFRYGLKNKLKPEYKGISKKYGDIEAAIEIKMEILQAADQISVDLLRDIFTVGALECLIDIGRKYRLPTDVFVAERAKYVDIPETAEEVQALPTHRLLKGV